MKNNILFFAQRIHAPWIEGVKNNAMSICEGLNKKVKISIISHKTLENNLDFDTIKGVDIFYLLKLNDNKFFQLLSFITGGFKSLFFVLKIKPTKIFVQYLDTSYILPLILIRIFRPKLEIIITLYSTDEISIGYKKLFFKYFSFQEIIIISEYLRVFVQELGYKDQNILYIPLSYDKERYLSYIGPEKRKKKTILFSAGIKKEAGSFFMVDLASIMPEYKFIFTMRKFDEKSENELKALEYYIREKKVKNIDLMRNISNMEELLSDVDIYVLPLQTIHIKMLVPVALLEAMGRGNTCFVSDLPHLKKLILDEQNAIIFEKNNVDDLKNKIENYSRDEKLGIQAYKFAESYPSFSNIIEEYYKLTIN